MVDVALVFTGSVCARTSLPEKNENEKYELTTFLKVAKKEFCCVVEIAVPPTPTLALET